MFTDRAATSKHDKQDKHDCSGAVQQPSMELCFHCMLNAHHTPLSPGETCCASALYQFARLGCYTSESAPALEGIVLCSPCIRPQLFTMLSSDRLHACQPAHASEKVAHLMPLELPMRSQYWNVSRCSNNLPYRAIEDSQVAPSRSKDTIEP